VAALSAVLGSAGGNVNRSTILICALSLAACGPQCFTWRDVTGNDRSEAIMKTEVRACNKQSGFDKKWDWRELQKHPEISLGIQNASRRRDDCMAGKGWKMTTETCAQDEI
jgi:hypothetical protein